MRGKSNIDLILAALADAQWGVVARRQLLAAGVSADQIDRLLRAGRLRPLYRGVYAVGHLRLRREAHWLAAVLACGDGAVLSHAAAAALWALRPQWGATLVDVTVPRQAPVRRPGIRVHRHAALARAEEVTVHEGIPVTTPARTLLDLAATFPRRTVERALDQAEILRLIDHRVLERTLAAHRGRRGSPSLRAILEHHAAGSTLTRSELEERFLALCDDHGIRRPRVNTTLHGFEVDFAWPGLGLVVEVDGYAYHHTRRAFERDRERDAVLAAHGIRTLRFTARQVTDRPAEVVAALEAVRSL
jgi:very-short-patch-repair endonuclease